MNRLDFRSSFLALTSNPPFPWQEALYERFVSDDIPSSCALPTGLGKTSVIAIWLIALANHSEKIPRRLVYVVNRRTVVDQATDEARKFRDQTSGDLEQALSDLCAETRKEKDPPLAISTLRGQFADNREWSADPSRPAIIVGTVDMIGSRLLFSGYGIGFKSKPLHAGFLGQDVLLVHDEAHLEPAFQKLIEAIRHEQKKEPAPLGVSMRLKVMALTATPRESDENPFELSEEEKTPPERLPDRLTSPIQHVWQRLKSKKGIAFPHPEGEKEKIADRIGKLAIKYADSGKAILVYVSSLEDHAIVCKCLSGKNVQMLTGTLRGLERDRMADPRKESGCPIFARFLKPPRSDANEQERWKITPTSGTVYLVCTSAGEVGIDISADHLICDLVAYDRMAQRFGRVNRYGSGDAEIDVVHEVTPDKKKEDDPNEKARWKTLELLKELPLVEGRRSASPLELMKLRDREELKSKFEAAYSPKPVCLETSDILFDSWALTTIQGKLPGRPMVEPYLHGLSDWEPPETHVAWREEVSIITGTLLDQYKPADLLEDYPLKPHELLRDRSDRVFKHLVALSERHPEQPAWLLDDDGTVQPFLLNVLADKDKKDRINSRTILLPPSVGGLQKGLLDGKSDKADDVADDWLDEKGQERRKRQWSVDRSPRMRLIRFIKTNSDADAEVDSEGDGAPKYDWYWFVKPRSADDDSSKTSLEAVTWDDHTKDVTRNLEQIIKNLPLPQYLKIVLFLAARFHDLGKKRVVWQRSIGNPNPTTIWLAKSGGNMKPIELTKYRHEFGSLIDVQDELEFQNLSDDHKALVQHLLATHHGRGRPHFPPDEVFDHEPKGRDVAIIAAEVPRRYARLQRKYGRWGLAYLESLLRAADYSASAAPSSTVVEDEA